MYLNKWGFNRFMKILRMLEKDCSVRITSRALLAKLDNISNSEDIYLGTEASVSETWNNVE